MKFSDFLNEALNPTTRLVIRTIQHELGENRIPNSILREGVIEVESPYDGEVYHITVDPLSVRLSERDEEISVYSHATYESREIAEAIVNKLQSFQRD